MEATPALSPSRLPRFLRSDARRDRLAPALVTAATIVGVATLEVRWAHYDDPAGIEPPIAVEGMATAFPAYAALVVAGGALIALLMVATRIDRRLLAVPPLLPAWLLFQAVLFIGAQTAAPGAALDPGFIAPLACIALLVASAIAAFVRR